MRTNSQHTIGILADDLTSAADGAGPQEFEPGFPLGRVSSGDDNTLRPAMTQLRFGASLSEQVL
jgi:hypothetical protein